MRATRSIFGTPSTSLGKWSWHAVIQRSPATWSFEDSTFIELGGDLYSPQASLIFQGDSESLFQSAVIGSLTVDDQATVQFDGSVEDRETAAIPGRARLVR